MKFDFLFHHKQLKRKNPDSLVDDLSLKPILDAMSEDDPQILDACKNTFLRPLTDMNGIFARREVMEDVYHHFNIFSSWLASTRNATERIEKIAQFQHPRYERVIPNQKKLLTEIEISKICIDCYRQIASSAAGLTSPLKSSAMEAFVCNVQRQYSSENLSLIERQLNQLNRLKQSENIVLSAWTGNGLKPRYVVLNEISEQNVIKQIRRRRGGVTIPLANTALVQNTEEIVHCVVKPLLRTVEAFNRNCREFFEKLNAQIGFYIGCCRLKNKLSALGVPMCDPVFSSDDLFESKSLINPSLALQHKRLPIGNDICFTGKQLVLITGDNQGGKTTYLRSVGIAQLMGQCGMFVTAQHYTSPVFSGVYTHFPSSEDAGHEAGLLDMELQKLSLIIDQTGPNSLLLMNESFQSTMPADAKHIADTTVQALCDAGVKVLFVTHLYAYASSQYAKHQQNVLCLRSHYTTKQSRYKITEGEPMISASGMQVLDHIVDAS